MTRIQKKIDNIVQEYKLHFKKEYDTFCHSMIDKREIQKNSFASSGQEGHIKQFLYEIPETLHNMIHAKLDIEEKEYFKSLKGGEWFGRTYKEFSPAALI